MHLFSEILNAGQPGANWFGSFPYWQVPGWIVDLSVGGGVFSGDISELPGLGLPPLGSEPAGQTPTSFPLPVDLRDEPSLPQVIFEPPQPPEPETVMPTAPKLAGESWFDYWARNNAAAMAPPVPIVSTGLQGDPAPHPDIPFIPNEEDNVGWITDIYTAIDTAVFAGELPGGAAPTGTSYMPTVPAGGNETAVVVTTPTVTADPGANVKKTYCYKFIDGQWKLVKMRRRRRKKLVTNSDIAGLAKLKGTVGMGKVMEMWIATHS